MINGSRIVIRKGLNKSFNSFLDFIYPARCAVCREYIYNSDYSGISQGNLFTEESSSHGDNPEHLTVIDRSPQATIPTDFDKIFCPWCLPSRRSLWRNLPRPRPDEIPKSTNPRTHKPSCSLCDEPLTEHVHKNDPLCIACSIRPMTDLFRGDEKGFVHSIWSYADQCERIVLALKYRSSRSLIPYCATQINRYIQYRFHSDSSPTDGFPIWDAIIPMPSTQDSLSERGYHHVYLTSRIVGKCLNTKVLPEAISTVANHPRQASLEIRHRYKNMRGAFKANKRLNRILRPNARVLLLDDVLTTGESVLAACEALTGSNVSRVDVITLARSPRFFHHRMDAIFRNAEIGGQFTK